MASIANDAVGLRKATAIAIRGSSKLAGTLSLPGDVG
jgi:hypothetical protein